MRLENKKSYVKTKQRGIKNYKGAKVKRQKKTQKSVIFFYMLFLSSKIKNNRIFNILVPIPFQSCSTKPQIDNRSSSSCGDEIR